MTIIDVPYIHGTTSPIPYASGEVADVQGVQVADTLFLVHPNHPPATLTRHADDDWRYEQPKFNYGPYDTQRSSDLETTLTLVGLTDVQVLTCVGSEAPGVAVGSFVEYTVAAKNALGKVLAISGGTVTIQPLEDRCYFFDKAVYAVGAYCGWSNDDGMPITTAIGNGSPAGYGGPGDPTGEAYPILFSHSQVILPEMVGNYICFRSKDGTKYWMKVSSVGDIMHNSSFGIVALGKLISPYRFTNPPVRGTRVISGDLTSSAPLFDSGRDVGRWFKLVYDTTGIHARVTSVASSTQVAVTINRLPPLDADGISYVGNSSTTIWQRGLWYTGNYPATVAFVQQRLAFGGLDDNPDVVMLSRSGDFYDFSSTEEDLSVTDDCAIVLRLASDDSSEILWMQARQTLLVGTAGSEWNIAPSVGAVLTPATVKVTQCSSHGSAWMQPIVAGSSLLFTQQGGQKLREMAYDYNKDNFESIDVTIFAEHILKEHGGVVQLAYTPLPESMLFVCCADGALVALTYEPDQKVYAWCQLPISGPGAKVLSIATALDVEGPRLLLVVQRTVNGAAQYTIEYMENWFTDTDRYLDAQFEVDLNNTYYHVNGTCYHLSLFAGQTVTAVIDGVVHTVSVAPDGTVVLPSIPGVSLHLGYPYRSYLRTLPLEIPTPNGTTQGKMKRVTHVTFRTAGASEFLHSSDEQHWYTEIAASTVEPMDRRIAIQSAYNTMAQYSLAVDYPGPFTLLAIYPEAVQTQN